MNTDCVSTYPTLLTPSVNNPNSPVTSFSNCEIEHGNSGSPILDDRGHIRGVIQAKFEPSTLEKLGLELSGDFLDGVPSDIGVGTNLGCVDFPEVIPTRLIPSACSTAGGEESEKEKIALSTAIADRLTHSALEEARGLIPAPLDDVFEWTIGSRKKGPLAKESITLVPKCFKPVKGWIKNYSGFFGSPKSSVSVKLSIPFWNAKVGYNRSLQIDGRIDPTSRGFYSAEIRFQPKDLVRSGASKTELVDLGVQGLINSGIYMSETLNLCPSL